MPLLRRRGCIQLRRHPPPSFRPPCLLPSHRSPPQALSPDVLSEIDKDTHRTFPAHPRLSTPEGQQAMLNVLRAYALADPEIGYTQVLPGGWAGSQLPLAGGCAGAVALRVCIAAHRAGTPRCWGSSAGGKGGRCQCTRMRACRRPAPRWPCHPPTHHPILPRRA